MVLNLTRVSLICSRGNRGSEAAVASTADGRITISSPASDHACSGFRSCRFLGDLQYSGMHLAICRTLIAPEGVPIVHRARNGRSKLVVDEQRQSNRRMVGISPFNAVAAVRRQVYRITWPQDAILRLASNHKASASREKHAHSASFWSYQNPSGET